MMSASRSTVFAVLDVVVSILAMVGLLPIAGGLPSIASPAVFYADAMWFTANLAGPLLLLAAGLRMLLRGVSLIWYVCGYTALVIVVGELRLRLVGFPRLTSGWLV